MSSPPFHHRRKLFRMRNYDDIHASQYSNISDLLSRLAKEDEQNDSRQETWYLDRDFDYRNMDHFSVPAHMMDLAEYPEQMKDWLLENYSKFAEYDTLKFELTKLLREYMPGFNLEDDYPLHQIIASLDFYLKELHQKIDKCNVELGELSGSELAAKISTHKGRVLDLIDDLEAKLTRANQEIAHHIVENADLHNQLTAVWAELDLLKRKPLNETLNEREFMEDLRSKASAFENKQSSLLKEVERITEENNELQRQVVQYAKQVVHSEENCMKEIASLSQSLDLNATIEEALMSMLERNISLQSSTPNREACENVVHDWITMLRAAIRDNKAEFDEVNYQVQQTNDQLASLQEELEEAKRKAEKTEKELEKIKNEVEEAMAELEDMRQVKAEFIEEIARQEAELQRLGMELGSIEQARLSSGGESALGNLLPSHEGSGFFSSPENEMSSSASPIALAPFEITPPLSPAEHNASFLSEAQHMSPLRVDPRTQNLTAIRVDPRTQTIDPGSRRVALANQTIPHAAGRIALGTQTMPFRGSRAAPRTQTLAQGTGKVAPGTQTIGRVYNRFDVGGSLGMRTSILNKPQPYAQTTRLDSTQPVAGSSRMIDSPLKIHHRAKFTPSSYRTPWISTTRFGYTDPTAKCLNLPPGDDLVFDDNQPANQGVLKKTVLLTSPQRQNPLLVNIDVLPRPLIHSPSGEHFVCDISLDVQDAKTQKTPITMVYRTPDVTPTTARRHGLIGTPRGIYKRNQRAIRRLFPSSDPSSSPKDFDKTLFAGSLSPEKESTFRRISPTLNQSPQVPTTPGLNQTVVRTSPGLNQTFVRTSPGLNQTFVRTPPVLQETLENAPRTESSSLKYLDRTLLSSGYPDLTSGTTPPTVFDQAIASSPSSKMNSSLRQTDHRLNETFERTSPGLNVRQRLSPLLRQAFDRTSPELNNSFEKTSPELNKSFERTSPGLGRRQRLSPLLNRAFDRTSPILNKTFERTSPGPNRSSGLDSSQSGYSAPISYSSPKNAYRTLSSGYPGSTFGTTDLTVFDQTISSSASPEVLDRNSFTSTFERTYSGQNHNLGMNSFQSEYSSPVALSSPKQFDRTFSSGYPNSTYGTTLPSVFDQTITSSASPEILDRSSLHSSSGRISPGLNRTFERTSPGLNVRQRLSPLLNEALVMSSPGLSSSSSGMNSNVDQQGDITYCSSGATDSLAMSPETDNSFDKSQG